MEVRSIRRKGYNGMEFADLVNFPTSTVEIAVSMNDKLVLKEGPLTLQRHLNSYTYKPELLLSCWSLQFPQLERRGVRDSKYWRTEFILAKLSDHKKIREWRDAFLEAARICDQLLKGIE